ncbi:hypothetical protein MMC10_001419 [Thelotrema lepadinum]|nr:hypothetical protein [Thelotrema lepadinum]
MSMYDPSMLMDNMSSDYSSQRSQFIQGCTGFAAGATAAVALRLFARWKNSTKIAWDDLSIALSLIPLWALAGTGVAIATYGGLAQQDDTLTPAQKAVFYPLAFASYILYALAITAAKLSILLLYRRIFTSLPFRRILYIFMALCTVWCTFVVLAAIFRCSPVAAAWSTDEDPTASCIPLQALYYATSSTNIALDILINLLPARQIWGLQLPKKQRILLVCCMCLGILSIAAGIGRILTVPDLISTNLSASIAMPFLFVIIEPSFAIMCACLPTYRPLALWVGQGIKNSRAGSRIKSFVSTQSMSNSSARRSRASLFPSRWRPTPSGNEKEVLTSANNTPDLSKASGDRMEFGRGWSSPQIGSRTTVVGGSGVRSPALRNQSPAFRNGL